MIHFPNAFVDKVQPLEQGIGERGDASLAALQARGYVVTTGLTRYFAGAISIMGQQHHIREYCPRDPTPTRFGTEESTERWLKKGGGRAMFLLLNQVMKEDEVVGHQLAGYGWTGVEKCAVLPDSPITSAYRLGANALGKGLAGDFVQAVVSGTNALYAPGEGIGLETWKSNHAAGLYPKVGFVLQPDPNEAPELRPTLDPSVPGGMVMDTRLYMSYPTELLA